MAVASGDRTKKRVRSCSVTTSNATPLVPANPAKVACARATGSASQREGCSSTGCGIRSASCRHMAHHPIIARWILVEVADNASEAHLSIREPAEVAQIFHARG